MPVPTEACPSWCSCATCAARKIAESERCAPLRVHEVEEALRSLVALIRRQGGYMTPEDQYALWRAETLLGLR